MERRHVWRPASLRAHKDSLPLVLSLDVSGCDTYARPTAGSAAKYVQVNVENSLLVVVNLFS